MNPSNMDSSDLTDKDLDYERTIARARRHSCTLLFLHIVMAVSPLLIIIFTGKFIAIVPLGLDVVGGFVDVWELNTFHFFRSALFKPLIIITAIITTLQLLSHVGLYFWMSRQDDINTDDLKIPIILFVGIGLSAVATIIMVIKNKFVLVRMVRGREELNRIKHSLLSEDHFQYALKKSLDTGN